MAGKACQALPRPGGGWAGRLTLFRQLQLQRPGWLQGAQDAWWGVGHPWSGCWACACSLRPVHLAGWRVPCRPMSAHHVGPFMCSPQ